MTTGMSNAGGFGGLQPIPQEQRALRSIDSSKYPETNKDFVKNIERLNQATDYMSSYMLTMQKGIDDANQNAIEQIQSLIADIIVIFAGGEPTGLDLGDLRYILEGIGALLGINPETPFPLNLVEAAAHLFDTYIMPLPQLADLIFDAIIAWSEEIGFSDEAIDAVTEFQEAIIYAYNNLEDTFGEFGQAFKIILDALGLGSGFFDFTWLNNLFDELGGLLENIIAGPRDTLLNILSSIIVVLFKIGTWIVKFNTPENFLNTIGISAIGPQLAPPIANNTLDWSLGGDPTNAWVFDNTTSFAGTDGSFKTDGSGLTKRLLTQTIQDCVPTDAYIIKGQIKWDNIPSGTDTLGLCIVYYLGETEISQVNANIATGHGVTGGWSQINMTVTVPNDVDGFRIGCRVSNSVNSGTVWIDDISCSKREGLATSIANLFLSFTPFKIFQLLLDAIVGAGGATIETAVNVIGWLVTNLGSLFTGILSAEWNIVTALGDFVELLVTHTISIPGAVVEGMSDLITNLTAMFGININTGTFDPAVALGAFIDAIVFFEVNIPATAIQTLANIITVITEFWGDVANGNTSAAQAAFNFIGFLVTQEIMIPLDILEGFWELLAGFTEGVPILGQIVGALVEGGTTLIDLEQWAATLVVDTVIDGINATIGEITDAITTINGIIGGIPAAIIEDIATALTVTGTTLGDIATWVGTLALDSVVDALSGNFTTLITNLGTILTGIASGGWNIVTGLNSFVTALVNNSIAIPQSVVTGLLTAVGAIFGIQQGGTNFATDPECVRADLWKTAVLGTHTISVSTEQFHSGTTSIKSVAAAAGGNARLTFARTTAGGNADTASQAGKDAMYTVQVNEKYHAEAWCRGHASNVSPKQFYITATFFKSSDWTSTTANGTKTTPDTTWRQATLDFTVPSGYDRMRVELHIDPGDTENNTYYIDDLLVRETTPQIDLISTITTAMGAAGTTLAQLTTALLNIPQGVVTGLLTAVASIFGMRQAHTNLAADPDCSRADLWASLGGVSTPSISATTPHSGTACLKHVVATSGYPAVSPQRTTAGGNATGTDTLGKAALYVVQPGDKFYVEAYVRSDAANTNSKACYIQMYAYDSTNYSLSSSSSSSQIIPGTSWEKRTLEWEIPAGRDRLLVLVAWLNNGTVGDAYYVDDWIVYNVTVKNDIIYNITNALGQAGTTLASLVTAITNIPSAAVVGLSTLLTNLGNVLTNITSAGFSLATALADIVTKFTANSISWPQSAITGMLNAVATIFGLHQGGVNLVADPDCSRSDLWVTNDGAGNTISVSSEVPGHSGTTSIKEYINNNGYPSIPVNRTVTGSDGGTGTAAQKAALYVVKPGERYYFEAWVRKAAGNTTTKDAYINVYFYDSTNYANSTQTNGATVTPTTTFQKVFHEYTVPASRDRMLVYMSNINGGTVGDIYYWDDPVVLNQTQQQTILDTLLGGTGKTLAELTTWVANTGTSIYNTAAGLAGVVQDLIQDIVDGFLGVLTGIPIIGGLFSALISAVQSLFGTANTAIAQLPQSGTYANIPPAGSGGTYTVTDTDMTLVDTGLNEIQEIVITGAPTDFDIRLTYSGQTLDAPGIEFGDSPSTVQTKLEALSNIAPGDIEVTGGLIGGTNWDDQVYRYRVEFKGTLAAQNLTQMSVYSSSFTGGTNPAVTIETTQQGVVGGWVPERMNTGSQLDNWVQPTNTGWTDVGLSGGPTKSLDRGALWIRAPYVAGDAIRGCYQTKPSTNFIIQSYGEYNIWSNQQQMCYLMMKASGGKYTTFGIGYVNNSLNMFVHNWTSATVFSSIVTSRLVSSLPQGMPAHLRIRRNGADGYFYFDFSYNGLDWQWLTAQNSSGHWLPDVSDLGLGVYNTVLNTTVDFRCRGLKIV